MQNYKVFVEYKMFGEYIIKANSKKEAEEIALSDDMKLPEDPTYMDGSIMITPDMETEDADPDEFADNEDLKTKED